MRPSPLGGSDAPKFDKHFYRENLGPLSISQGSSLHSGTSLHDIFKTFIKEQNYFGDLYFFILFSYLYFLFG